jgi:transcriptional regulator with XRE-family HTH domain
MKVHEKIRTIRQSKNWSQDDMAEKLGMTASGYAKIEQGRTDNHFSKLEQIAKIFDMEVVELLAFGEKNVVFFIGDNSIGNNSINMVGDNKELMLEIEKLQMQLDMKDKELAMQQREITYLKELLDMHKTSKPNLAE